MLIIDDSGKKRHRGKRLHDGVQVDERLNSELDTISRVQLVGVLSAVV